MTTATIQSADRCVRAGLNFLEALLAPCSYTDYAVRFWDGTVWRPPAASAPPRFTLVLNHPAALRRMFLQRSQRALGEAYIFQDFDLEGDIEAAFALGDHLQELHVPLCAKLQLATELLPLLRARGRQAAEGYRARLHGRSHSKRRDAQAVTHHYDVSNDFYRLWLDREMIYSCAYFTDRAEELDRAQQNKLDYLCRKLRLRPGERLLDIGCGWGGLLRHAATHFGVEGVGITLSHPQAELANERFHAAGLADRCRALVCDYREFQPKAPFDKIVSVGMCEHVGEKPLGEYFRCAWQLLKQGGAFLNHGIAAGTDYLDSGRRTSFIHNYVFPDGELLPISPTLHTAESAGFEVRDVESLREHYALTLRHWVRRLEAHRAAAMRLIGETGYRIWQLYMAGSAYGFTRGRLNLYQALLIKPQQGTSPLPLTRADWYVQS